MTREIIFNSRIFYFLWMAVDSPRICFQTFSSFVHLAKCSPLLNVLLQMQLLMLSASVFLIPFQPGDGLSHTCMADFPAAWLAVDRGDVTYVLKPDTGDLTSWLPSNAISISAWLNSSRAVTSQFTSCNNKTVSPRHLAASLWPGLSFLNMVVSVCV